MSHVDEGTIHAWLDGAFAPDDAELARIEEHLAGCEACRQAVETERRIRERAADVLSAAAPDAVRVAPFDQILAERRRRDALPAGTPAAGSSETDPEGDNASTAGAAGGPDSAGPDITPRRRGIRMPVALAATLVLALGATWFARRMLPGTDADSAATQFRAAESMEEDAVSSTAPTPQAGLADAEPGRQQRAAAEPPAMAATPPPAARDEAVAIPQAAPPAVVAGAQTGTTTVTGQSGAAAAPPPAAADQRARSPEETRRLAESALRSEALAGLAANASPARFADADAALALDRLNAADPGMVWTPTGPDTLVARLGMVPLGLEGLAPDSVQIATVGGAAVARMVYSVDGQPVELLQWATGTVSGESEGFRELQQRVSNEARPDVAAKAVAPASPAVFRIGGIDFVIRGPLSADSLAVLSRRVGPAG